MIDIDLPEELRQKIFAHCLAALPNEGCGMLALDHNRVVGVYPTGNLDVSPMSYTVPPQEHFEALTDAESHGWELDGVFHSHPHGPARMSTTDLARVTDPGWLYVIVDLSGRQPVMGAWRNGSEVGI